MSDTFVPIKLDVSTKHWTELPKMANGRDDHACGIAKGEVVVAGGNIPETTDSVEILNLETLRWRYGKSLPQPMEGAASINYGDSFLVVSGYRSAEGIRFYLNTIYEYDPRDDSWIEWGVKLRPGRAYHAAIPIPDDGKICQ